MSAGLLGKKPPLHYYADDKAKLADFLDLEAALPASPATWAWGKGITFGMYLNDSLPDCTCAAVGHLEEVYSMRAGAAETPTDAAVKDLFDYSGKLQHLSENDGRYMAGDNVGVLDCWKQRGFRQADGSLEKITGYAAVKTDDLSEMTVAGYYFGGLSIGVALAELHEYQWEWYTSRGKLPRWSTSLRFPDGSRNLGDPTPGSWGGHEMNITARRTDGWIAITWATRVLLTDGFIAKYGDEQYAVLSPDQMKSSGVSFTGLDLTKLEALLAQLG